MSTFRDLAEQAEVYEAENSQVTKLTQIVKALAIRCAELEEKLASHEMQQSIRKSSVTRR